MNRDCRTWVVLAGLMVLLGWGANPAGADEVLFQYKPSATGQTVFLAGSFNSWNPTANPMSDEDGDGVFELTMDLQPGRYEYKFVVGGTWYEDPHAAEYSDDGYGGKNSILDFSGSGTGVVSASAGAAAGEAASPTTDAPIREDGTYPILFTYTPGVAPQHLYLAGSFNSWNPQQDLMTDEDGDGTYAITMFLAPGSYPYKFVADGSWITDESAAEFTDDGFGGQNSVILVADDGAVAGAVGAMGKPVPDGLFQVTFSFRPAGTAQNIVLAGGFNDWSTTSTQMSDTEGDGTWEVTLVLPGGTYPYKFVVDGNWTPDPTARATTDDGFGGQNSVISVDDTYPEVVLEAGDGLVFTYGLGHSQDLTQRNMLEDNDVLLRTRVYKDDVEGVSLAWRPAGERIYPWRMVPMTSFSSDVAFAYYETHLSTPEPLSAFHYAFVVRDGDTTLWLGDGGFGAQEEVGYFTLDPATVERLRVPEWVRDGIFYQIFPDRFFNANKHNDPAFKEPFYEGKTRLPRMGHFDGEYFHLVKDWYDFGGLAKSPYRSDGRPDYYSFYGGDIEGVMEKLPYLKDLGITIIYFNPVFQAKSNHKYDTADFNKIDPHLADEATFKAFVAKAHEMGIRVVLDTVFNHCGDMHAAFQDCVKRGPDSEYWEWFEWKQWPLPDPEPADYKPEDYYACWWGFGSLPDFNFDLARSGPDENGIRDIAEADPNRAVVDYLIGAASYWVRDLDVDGLRLDVPNEVPYWFWTEFTTTLKSIKPDLYIVAELWGDASDWIRPNMVDATMNYRYFRDPVLKWIGRGEGTAASFGRELAPGRSVYPPQSQQVMMNLIDSHDTERFVREAKGDTRRLMLAATFQMTYVGAPHIYYGDEVAMDGGGDPDCRRPFYWRYEKEPARVKVRDHYRKMTSLRQELPVLRRGSFTELLADGQVYAYARRLGDETVVVVLNNQDRPATATVPMNALAGLSERAGFADLLANLSVMAKDGALEVSLDPVSGRVLRLRTR